MHKFFSFIKEFRIPQKQELKDALASFSKKEFYIFTTTVVVSFLAMITILNQLNNKLLVDVPIKGGSIIEGIIGMPTLVNPVLALSDADKDLSSLVYSGLMRRTPDGNFIPDLAESYTISPDGLTYTFILKKNVKFHDGFSVTADDVIFTIDKIKDPLIKSPRMGWNIVTVTKKDDITIVFTLNKTYISFMDNMTIGILPSHIWKNIKDGEFNISPYNIKAIGSGPYKIDSVIKNKDGIPQQYTLKSFSNFALGNPNIKKVTIKSFSNEKDLIKDLSSGAIDQAGNISAKNISTIVNNDNTIHTTTLPRIFGLFYNSSNNKIFTDANVIKAFNYAIDKQEIIDKVLYGYGTVANNPVPKTIMPDAKIDTDSINIDKANELLNKSGWILGSDGIRVKGGTTTVTKTKKVGKKTVTEKVKVNNGPVTQLSFSLTTGDTPELRSATEIIKKQLEMIGVRVDTARVYEMGPLNQIIRNREYEALFFGQIINHESDLYSFWHSSQRKDPGLNISMYNNAKADKILDDVQKIVNYEDRVNKYKSFIEEFNNDLPALLIYSPKYLYITSNKLNNINLNTLINPTDRFASIYKWYANKDHVWKIFTKK